MSSNIEYCELLHSRESLLLGGVLFFVFVLVSHSGGGLFIGRIMLSRRDDDQRHIMLNSTRAKRAAPLGATLSTNPYGLAGCCGAALGATTVARPARLNHPNHPLGFSTTPLFGTLGGVAMAAA